MAPLSGKTFVHARIAAAKAHHLIALLITNLAGGGAEKALLLWADWLCRQGRQVRIYTLEPPDSNFALPEGVELVPLVVSRLSRGAWRFLLLPMQALELRIRLQRQPVEALVSYLYRPNFVAVLASLAGRNQRVFLTEHIACLTYFQSRGLFGKLLERAVKALYPRAQSIAAVSRGVRRDLLKAGVPGHKVCVIDNPVDVAQIQASARLPHSLDGWMANKPTVITVGRLVPQKDQATLIRAVARARQTVDLQLLIVGRGPLEESLRKLAQEVGMGDRVLLAGWQNNPFSLIRSSAVFVMSSLFEGFGIALVEAMACGVPVISTDCPSGPAEILQNGRFGGLVAVGDSEALAGKIISLIADSSFRSRKAADAEKRAWEYDISKIGPLYLKWIQAAPSAW